MLELKFSLKAIQIYNNYFLYKAIQLALAVPIPGDVTDHLRDGTQQYGYAAAGAASGAVNGVRNVGGLIDNGIYGITRGARNLVDAGLYGLTGGYMYVPRLQAVPIMPVPATGSSAAASAAAASGAA